jgi:hypothetical protein
MITNLYTLRQELERDGRARVTEQEAEELLAAYEGVDVFPYTEDLRVILDDIRRHFLMVDLPYRLRLRDASWFCDLL